MIVFISKEHHNYEKVGTIMKILQFESAGMAKHIVTAEEKA